MTLLECLRQEALRLGRCGLSSKELSRVEVMGRVKAGSLRLQEAAELLWLSYRQAKRVWARYRGGGAKALQHGNCGRVSNRAHPEEFRQAVLVQVGRRYADFGPTLAAEHLEEEDGLQVAAETLRRWMKAAGLWRRQRARKPYRQRRMRKPHFGELVQLDASFHPWLEDRAANGCLMHMVDDATGTVLCQFSAGETTWAAAHLLRAWIERYGVPRALYTDWKNVYVRLPNVQERLRGEAAVTQFGQMCAKLGIRIIAASSPQAKGRVERVHGTHQDRLVKKLRLATVSNYDDANAYLQEHYIAQHNRHYARPAAAEADYHRQRPTARQLDDVFWLEEERVLSEDWVVRYKNRLLQLARQNRHWAPAQSRVRVRENEPGHIVIHYRGQSLPPLHRLETILNNQCCRTMIFQRTATTPLIPCLSPRVHFNMPLPPPLSGTNDTDFASDPGVAFDTLGNVFSSYIVVFFGNGSGVNGTELAVARSTDNGRTFPSATFFSFATGGNHFNDKPLMAADTNPNSLFRDHLYVAWDAASGGSSAGGIRVAHSSNHGASFTVVRADTPSGPSQSIGADPFVGPNGELYVAWNDYHANVIAFNSSFDGGITFGAERIVSPKTAAFDIGIPAESFRRALVYPACDTDRSRGPHHGRLYCSWMDLTTSGTTDILLSYSDDQGNTWSKATPVTDQLPFPVDRFNHWLSVDPITGDVNVSFYDTRNDTTGQRFQTDVFFSQSRDGGKTFRSPNTRVTNALRSEEHTSELQS